jgi:integrase
LRRAGKATSTRNNSLSLIFSIMRHAVACGLIDESVYDTVRRCKTERAHNERVRYLSAAEERRLMAVLEGEMRDIVLIALHTGMRRGEILRVEWRWVDLDNGTIYLPDSKSGRPRAVYLNDVATVVLERRKGKHDERVFTLKGPALHKRWRKICEQAKVYGVRFHDLRHTFASRLAMAGARERELMELLGHNSTAMVQRYTHLAEDTLRARVQLLVGCHDGCHDPDDGH